VIFIHHKLLRGYKTKVSSPLLLDTFIISSQVLGKMAITAICCNCIREPQTVLHQPKIYFIMEVIIMKGKFIWRMIFALLVITVFTLGSIAIYRMGFTHGAMTNITLPEGSDFPVTPYAHRSLGWHYSPRLGLLGIFPLLCFGGFFFLMLMFGFGFIARKRSWMHHYGPGPYPGHWKHHGTPPWGPDKAPPPDTQNEAKPESPSTETRPSEE
jgi:hypothetical protein